LGRDKRKEYNEIALPLYATFEEQLISSNQNKFPVTANTINRSSFTTLKCYLSGYKLRQLDKAIEKYEISKVNCGSYKDGIYEFSHPEILISAIIELQKLCKPR
jgi:hypothetical protein